MLHRVVVAKIVSLSCSLSAVAGIADTELIYEFSGTLPEGASSHSQIEDGESFTATFTIDTTVRDSAPGDPTEGIYEFNVLSGTIEFSGGFSQDLHVDDFSTAIFDDSEVNFGESFLDGVRITDIDAPGSFDFSIMAFVQRSDTPIPTLADDSLPGPGIAFTSFLENPPPGGVMMNQLVFVDHVTGESVEYFSPGGATNISFRVIPSPGALALFGVASVATRCRRRWTQRWPVAGRQVWAKEPVIHNGPRWSLARANSRFRPVARRESRAFCKATAGLGHLSGRWATPHRSTPGFRYNLEEIEPCSTACSTA